jgi:hypothetical protein
MDSSAERSATACDRWRVSMRNDGLQSDTKSYQKKCRGRSGYGMGNKTS